MAIDKRELMIGNVFNCYGITGLVVKELMDEYATSTTEEGAFFYKDIEPIPLSPDILNKCGFEIINNYQVNKSIEDCHIVLIEFPNNIYGLNFTGAFGMVSPKHKLKYLHQLQNLYYSLTSTELNIQCLQTDL